MHAIGECTNYTKEVAFFNGHWICAECAVKLLNTCQKALKEEYETLTQLERLMIGGNHA
jgi:hypothetical protein